MRGMDVCCVEVGRVGGFLGSVKGKGWDEESLGKRGVWVWEKWMDGIYYLSGLVNCGERGGRWIGVEVLGWFTGAVTAIGWISSKFYIVRCLFIL